ncbi:hypothetical protein TRFO_10235 [Tritrichomonas foetus]|uniref:Uncharacterized protein n=1 Tax=Tritrichomonas foetus TaxID=1144522 RepID=A0A1J4JBK3_9EUKA|nr:hypothetical protein TRFO_10235 [Tritrichomonas foetus]|eukprot:OHS96049.1 hypothetical protein TRFO_10235 [Tritrichomonas foetus]
MVQQKDCYRSPFSFYVTGFIFIVLTIVGISVSISKNKAISFISDVDFLYYPKRDIPIYICIICVTNNSPRTPALLQSWGNDFLSTTTNTVLKFVSRDPNPPDYMKDMNLYYSAERRMTNFRYVFYMNYLSAHDFYENSNASWYVRTTYDCLVHLERFYDYMDNLSKKYDPNKDVVFKGKVVSKHVPKYTYIHGGSGWIMSRAAVKKYLDLEQTMKTLYENAGHGDDVNIVNFPKLLKMDLDEVDDGAFLGSPLKDEEYNATRNFDFSGIKRKCRFTNVKAQNPVPASKIIFFHNGRKKDYVFTIGKKMLDMAPPNIRFQSTHHYSELCTVN